MTTSGTLAHPLTGQGFPSPVPPGTGWPGDPATAETPVAYDASQVVTMAGGARSLAELSAEVSVCRACPRLVRWREQVAVEKRASFADQPYWGRPIAGWGDSRPRVLLVGLAPAANGGNRTGRVFTGDRSGDWLFASLHRVGLAELPTSEHAGDGQRLVATRMVAAVRCAPPGNAPTPVERDTCAPWLDAELGAVLPSLRVVVCLGSFGWDALWRALGRLRVPVPRPRPRFGHGARATVSLSAPDGPVTVSGGSVSAAPGGPASRSGRRLEVLGCYHPSRQNTFTGKLTEPMLDDLLGLAAALAHP